MSTLEGNSLKKIFYWLVTIGVCIVLVPVGCVLLLINVIWSIADKLTGIIKRGGFYEQ